MQRMHLFRLNVNRNFICKLKVELVDNQSRLIWFLEFQNVLRELEQKKPQLDELVKTAENLRESPIRQHIPEKGKLVNSNIYTTYTIL